MTANQTTSSQPERCNADFTIAGEHANKTVSAGENVVLQADDTEATTYRWEVTTSPSGSPFTLEDENKPTANLTVQQQGCACLIQLTVTKGQCQHQARRRVWITTPHHGYRLPTPGDTARFNGDDAWAGDLVQVLRDVDSNLPTDNQKAALDAAPEPSASNAFVTQSKLAAQLPGVTEKHTTA